MKLFYPGDKSRSKWSQETKQLEKVALNIKTNFVRPTFYDQAYPQRLWTTSPGIPVGITIPNLVFFSVQLLKKYLEKWMKPIFWQFSATDTWSFFGGEICSKRNYNCTHCLFYPLMHFICIILRNAERAWVWIIQKFIGKRIFQNFQPKSWKKNQKSFGWYLNAANVFYSIAKASWDAIKEILGVKSGMK